MSEKNHVGCVHDPHWCSSVWAGVLPPLCGFKAEWAPTAVKVSSGSDWRGLDICQIQPIECTLVILKKNRCERRLSLSNLITKGRMEAKHGVQNVMDSSRNITLFHLFWRELHWTSTRFYTRSAACQTSSSSDVKVGLRLTAVPWKACPCPALVTSLFPGQYTAAVAVRVEPAGSWKHAWKEVTVNYQAAAGFLKLLFPSGTQSAAPTPRSALRPNPFVGSYHFISNR